MNIEKHIVRNAKERKREMESRYTTQNKHHIYIQDLNMMI